MFVGIQIPEPARSLAWEAFGPIREEFPKAKWVPAENFHVTLKFLGLVWPRLVTWVEEGCARAAAAVSPFEIGLSGGGCFPRPHEATTLWAGVCDQDSGTRMLVGCLDEELGEEFPAEKRAFSPHLTVARSRPALDLGERLEGVSLVAEPWMVSQVVLFESHLGRPAPRYEVIARVPLKDA